MGQVRRRVVSQGVLAVVLAGVDMEGKKGGEGKRKGNLHAFCVELVAAR